MKSRPVLCIILRRIVDHQLPAGLRLADLLFSSRTDWYQVRLPLGWSISTRIDPEALQVMDEQVIPGSEFQIMFRYTGKDILPYHKSIHSTREL